MNAQWLEILIVAMVAGVLLFRLYSVLGRRTGHEPQPQPRVAPQTPGAPDRSLAPPDAPAVQGGSGLLDIQLADRNFDTAAFVSGARNAYAMISAAYEKADRAQLKTLLSPDVYAAFDSALAARDATPAHFESLKEARIVGASLQDGEAQITLAFTADFTDQAGSRSVTDVWTFARRIDAADPNWLLVATGGDLPE
jgi:predicted lipid-binding transport protein (Tim44 family)